MSSNGLLLEALSILSLYSCNASRCILSELAAAASLWSEVFGGISFLFLPLLVIRKNDLRSWKLFGLPDALLGRYVSVRHILFFLLGSFNAFLTP